MEGRYVVILVSIIFIIYLYYIYVYIYLHIYPYFYLYLYISIHICYPLKYHLRKYVREKKKERIRVERPHLPWIQGQDFIVAILMSVGWSDGHSLDPSSVRGKAPKQKVQWIKICSGWVGMPRYLTCGGSFQSFGVRPQEWVWWHFRGSLMVYDLFSAASHIRAVEAVMAHQKGWKPPGANVTFPKGKGWEFYSWASCLRE